MECLCLHVGDTLKKNCLVYVRPSIYMYLSPLLGLDNVKLHHCCWYLIGKLVLLKKKRVCSLPVIPLPFLNDCLHWIIVYGE